MMELYGIYQKKELISMPFYQKSVKEILTELQVTENGLEDREARERLERDGPNEIEDREAVSIWKLFLTTFKDPMVIVLLIAAGIQMALGDFVESFIILLVLLLNAIISVVQTKKAESSLAALRDLSAPEAKIIRGGVKKTIPARELVPGDVVFLEAGDYVPADGRIIDSGSLRVIEGMLTGESEAIEKTTDPLEDEVGLGDQINMVFSSSLVAHGRGTFIVTGTGNESEIGKIATLLKTAGERLTPLQRKLNSFSKRLGVGILLLSILIFAVQVGRIWFGAGTEDLFESVLNAMMFSVAVAVAAVPEALSSIVTIVLSVGTNKMAKQHAIIRKLPAVETLGSTSIICTDKTGTLTQNKMTVTDYFIPGQKDKDFPEDPGIWNESERRLIDIMVLCNDSYINKDGNEIGDPTEVALIQFADRVGEDYEQIRHRSPREMELPFDSDRKLMSTVHKMDDGLYLFIKGGPDVVFHRASRVLIDGEELPFTEEKKREFTEVYEGFSDRALRGLAYGYKKLSPNQKHITHDDEADIVLVGLTAMIDPPREAVYEAVREAKSAGIRTIMITGDHKTTAQAIARDIGIIEADHIALSGQELDALTDEELDEKLTSISVYARVSPENKIRIVKAWQKQGKVTAMTGDGVNDAPALKQADIGIAMGSGTDVSKDASAMILTDDNFVSIVNAVGVGRTVFSNIKKAIGYLFAGNLGAIIAILYAVILGLPNPFTALQLLFINLVNDSLPAIALGMEEREPDVMKEKPRDLDEGILSDGLLKSIIVRGILIGIAVIVSFYLGLAYSEEMGVAMAFTTLILARTLQTFTARSNKRTIFGLGLFSNRYVIGAVVICFGLYGLTLLPFLREIFRIPVDFGWSQWIYAAGLSLLAVIMMEIVKKLTQRN